MNFHLSFEYNKISIETLENFVNVFCSSAIKKIEIEQHPNLLSVNPISGKANSDNNLSKFCSFIEFKNYYTNNDFIYHIEFIFINKKDDFEVLRNTHIRSYTSKNNNVIEDILKLFSTNNHFIGGGYFNPYDEVCNAMGLGFGFKPLQTNYFLYFPGNLLVIKNEIATQIGDLYPFVKEKYVNSVLLCFLIKANDITFELPKKGIVKFFSNKNKYTYSSVFNEQKKFIDLLLESGILAFDRKKYKSGGYEMNGIVDKNKDGLINYYWLDNKGNVVPKLIASKFYYVKSINGEVIEEKILDKTKNNDFSQSVSNLF